VEGRADRFLPNGFVLGSFRLEEDENTFNFLAFRAKAI
jgi:hypothetical protein